MAADPAAKQRKSKGPRPKHVPERTCVACRKVDAKRQYTRLVRTPEGRIEVDPTGKANGRGAYLCRTRRCWKDAIDGGALGRALRVELDSEDRERLWIYARTHFPPDEDNVRGG